ncbi:TIGR03943 family putative permease subunit [Anaerocolumna sp.]|uniref:TIGR03943 family putative permease subunit n=1 Tax=Anaerocolumna sp. TaxID=2041569 RepID=UPI0028A7F5E8|nr:hypothetical protein [Anaerocolumna sp.]
MRKIVVLVIGLIFILAGCESKSPVNQGAKNGNGTPAVNSPESSEKNAEVPDISEVPIQTSGESNISEIPIQNYEESYISETPIQNYEEPYISETPIQNYEELNNSEIPVHASNGTDVNKLSAQDDDSDIIEIKEKMFIAQTNDIYFNPVDYLGKTIKYEGIFNVHEVPETDTRYYSVIRYGPGCCGVDAYAGFEVIWDKDYPEQEDWVEAVGVLKEYEENGYQYLRLELTSLTVLSTRGEEYVYQ